MQDLPQEVLNSLAAAGSSQLSSKQLAVKLNADHQKVVGAIKSLGTKLLNHVLPRTYGPPDFLYGKFLRYCLLPALHVCWDC
jgi:hypothetical protein